MSAQNLHFTLRRSLPVVARSSLGEQVWCAGGAHSRSERLLANVLQSRRSIMLF
jgi:hypothetical protein